MNRWHLSPVAVLAFVLVHGAAIAEDPSPLILHWEKNYLTISGEHLPGGEMKVHYLEAYCRDGSTDADWREHTKIPHQTELLEVSDDGMFIKLQCTVNDGLRVTHEIRSTHDEVDFRITAHNPTDKRSEAHWAQPCIRLDKFSGANQETYLEKSFVFLDGKLERMPTRDWATEARYTPGQVWCPQGVNRNDVNPRPLSDLVPSNGLIGCFSEDESMLFATAFEPYQELFQGVIVCLHSDFRLGGLQPGEKKEIRGKIYILPNDVPALLKRYTADFPEHMAVNAAAGASATAPSSAAGERMLGIVQTLASDEYEGRGIGTDGLVKAQRYIAEQFTDAGLNVVAAGGDPFQEFDVVDGAELTAPNTLAFQGPSGQTIELKLGEDLQVCSFGAADKFDAPLVFGGYAIQSKDPAYDDFAGMDVKGKAVVIMRRTPQQGRDDGMFHAGHHGVSRHAALRTKVSNAFRAGAAAIIFVNDPYTGRHEARQIAEQLQRARADLAEATQAVADAVNDADKLAAAKEELDLVRQRVEQTEQVANEHSVDPLMEFGYGGTRSGKAVPILHISQAACDQLLTATLGKTLKQIENETDSSGTPQSAELTDWQAVGETNLTVNRVDVANVVGVLEGEGPLADETIVIGAHYDHIGFGGEGSLSPGSHEIHNGADDNASGAAALIELARRFANRDTKPARRLVFIAFTGEERGLLGSAHYVKEPLFPLEKTIAMFNMDMVGRLEDDKLTVFGAGTSPRWEKLLDGCAEGKDLLLVKKPEGFGPSDHSSFYAKEMPVLHLFTGTHDDYHRPGDDTEKINLSGMQRIVDFLDEIILHTLATAEPPKYVAIEQRATLTRSGNRPYFGSIPDFGTDTEGYALQGVSPGSPADKGGLRGGDIIVQLGADQIGSLDDFDLALRKYSPGQQVTVIVLRGGKRLELQVVLAAPKG